MLYHMKMFNRICIILLYLPGVWATGFSGDLSFDDIRKNSRFATVVVIIYWLALLAGLVLIITAYLGK